MIKRNPKILYSLFPKVQWVSKTSKPLFTFDDGPDEVWTPLFSELSEKYELAAFFFLVGDRINRNDVLEKIISDGHEIAWHSQSHNSFWALSDSDVKYEIDSYKSLEDKIQRKIEYFRFPYGHFYPKHINTVLEAGLKIMMWSFMCHDYKKRSSVQLKQDLEQIRKNDIVLYHDRSQNSKNAYWALSKYLEERRKTESKKYK